MGFKIPESILVVIHTPDLMVLLIERVKRPVFWQSVSGSLDTPDEPFAGAAVREVREETGIDATQFPLIDWKVTNRFRIFRRLRNRYAPGVMHNVEHVFGLTVPAVQDVRLAPDEHRAWMWLPWREAAAKTISWSNRDAILLLPQKSGRRR